MALTPETTTVTEMFAVINSLSDVVFMLNEKLDDLKKDLARLQDSIGESIVDVVADRVEQAVDAMDLTDAIHSCLNSIELSDYLSISDLAREVESNLEIPDIDDIMEDIRKRLQTCLSNF